MDFLRAFFTEYVKCDAEHARFYLFDIGLYKFLLSLLGSGQLIPLLMALVALFNGFIIFL